MSDGDIDDAIRSMTALATSSGNWARDIADAISAGDATPAQVDEYAQHHERQWLAHYTELLRVRPDANPDDAVAGELVRLRGENSQLKRRAAVGMSMRLLCQAALDWESGANYTAQALIALIQRDRDSIAAALVDGSIVDGSPQPTPTLTPAEWSALYEAGRAVRDPNVVEWNFDNVTPQFRALVGSAIDKLTKARST